MRVVVNPDMTCPAVAVNIWYRVGSADETVGHFGFAHLFEHLMFSGTTSGIASGEHLAAVESVGGTANATTSFDRTNFFETVPAGALELALWLESERLAHLAVTTENLDIQREVVKEEKRQRYDNLPYGDMLAHLLAQQFGADGVAEGHPYAHPTIGSVPDLDAACLDDVVSFHRQWYRPDNACLVIAGCVDADRALLLADRYLGAVPAGEGPAPYRDRTPSVPSLSVSSLSEPSLTVPALPLPSRRVLEREVPRTAVSLSWPSPPVTDADQLSLEDALSVLQTGMASRLVRHLLRDLQLVEGISGYDLGLSRGRSTAALVASLRPGVEESRYIDEVSAALRRLAAEGPTAAEMARVHAQVERDWLLELATADDRADAINFYETIMGSGHRVNDYLDRMGRVGADDVARAAARWLDPDKASVLVYRRLESGPAGGVEAGVEDEAGIEDGAGVEDETGVAHEIGIDQGADGDAELSKESR
ncbi:M16 family metallopeptidase [Acidipropionibacterium jensenii]|nr:pitrilysin family protein [Acidipropionibacterium jensenii]